MNRTIRNVQRPVALGFTVCLLLLSGLVYVQLVAHAGHHAHHQAATHATLLCTWMCAAGQAVEGISVLFSAELAPVGSVDLATSEGPQRLPGLALQSRGPPVPSPA